jgi:hypothetical protein
LATDNPCGPRSVGAPRASLATSLAIVFLALGVIAAHAGPPFRTDDPEPVALHHWEVYVFSAMTWTKDDTGGVAPGIEVNFGAAPNLQLHLVAPQAIDRPAGGPTLLGPGDVELGAKYRFVQEDDHGWRPQVGVFPLVELPTGEANRGLGAGRTRVFLPVWLQKSSGDWLTYGGGGYWINPGPDSRNYWFAGWLLQRQVTKQLALGAEAYYQTADTVGGKDSPGFNVGGVYDFNEHTHLLFSAGRGLANAKAANKLSCYLALQWTF